MPVSRNGHDSCLIIQDRFSKLIEVIPTTKTVSALQVANSSFFTGISGATVFLNLWFLIETLASSALSGENFGAAVGLLPSVSSFSYVCRQAVNEKVNEQANGET